MAGIRELVDISQWDISTVDIGVMVGYFVLMMVVGWICKSMSKDISDYVRMGCKSTWWLMGTSLFMLMTSAATFTGGAGQAYMSGWSFVLMGIGSLFGYLCMAAFFAPWMRRTRAVTPPDAIRLRYGSLVEQINAYLGAISGMLWGGVWLYSFGGFMAVIFGVPIPTVVIAVGIVVIFYSVSGGSWSVQITDTLQAYILVPIALVVLFLSLRSVGWFGGLQEAVHAKGLQGDFKVFMEVGHEYTSDAASVGLGFFSTGWLLATLAYSFILSANMTACWRFLSVKSDWDARKAALLAGVLLCAGTAIWSLPAMVGRINYEDEINELGRYTEAVTEVETVETDLASPMVAGEEAPQPTGVGAVAPKRRPRGAQLNNPADGAYAVVARNILPPGLLGLVVIGLFAATMSSLDSSLTGNAGIVTNNLYPPLARLFGKEPWAGKKLVRLTQVVSFLLGCWAVTLALLFYKYTGEMSVFELGQEIIGLVSAPMVAAMVLSFFVPWLPWWGPLVGMGVGFAASVLFKFSGDLAVSFSEVSWLPVWLGSGINVFGEWVKGLMWHHRIFFNMGFTVIPTLASSVFWYTATPEYRARVDHFFQQIRTPIDFKREHGESVDHSLMKIIGTLGLVIAGAICVLLIFTRDDDGRFVLESVFAVLFVAGCVGTISLIMLLAGRRAERKLHRQKATQGG